MRPGITSKLFVAFLLTNVVTAVVVILGVRWGFDTGFQRYVTEREQQRQVRLADQLARAYREAGSWDFLRGHDEAWIELNQAGRRPPPGPGFGRPPPGVVLDTHGAVIIGDAHSKGELERRPITVDGTQVGWLASPPRRGNPFDVVDRRFQVAQWEAGWMAALTAVGLSALVAWLLARGLIAPVKRIATATRSLADGDYTVRVTGGSRDEIGRLVDDFNRLGHALARHEELRRNFMADASHELRTPLAVLRGEIEALQDGVRAATPDTLASLRTEVDNLQRLVDDIHDLSLADAGGLTYRFEAVDLAALARAQVHGAAAALETRNLAAEVRAPESALVRGDARRLEQLLRNLLANSLRYTDAGGRVVATLARRGNRMLLVWEDSAPGVPPEDMPRLFERLFRVEASRNRESGGSGLGLSICKGIVEAHGGAIRARASALGGLAIEVELPLVEKAR